MNKKNPLYIVICIYSISLVEIIKILKKEIERFDFKCVIVNNALKVHPIIESNYSEQWYCLDGSNTDNEFSAYVEGLNFLSEKFNDKDIPILIFNDTTITRHNFKFYIKAVLNNYSFIKRVKSPAIVGRVDSYNSICYSNPWSNVNGYVSSFIMLVNSQAAYAFEKTLTDIDLYLTSNEDIFGGCWSDAMPLAFREFIISHLVDLDSPIVWYQAKGKNKDRIYKKARCVFHEHYISGLIARDGIMVSIFPTWKLKIKNIIFEQLIKIHRLFVNHGW